MKKTTKLMNGSKEELDKWRNIPYSWIERLNIVKVSVLPNLIYRFNTISIKIPASYFVDINKPILKLIWRDKRPRRAYTILKKNKVRRLTLLDFKIYYKAIVIKTVWYWSMEQNREPRNRPTQLWSINIRQRRQ